MSRGDSSMPPQGHASCGFWVIQDTVQGRLIDDHQLVLLEVMAQPTSRHEHAVGEFLVVRVPLFCWHQYPAEVVDWVLDPMGLAIFGSFDQEYGTSHLLRGCDVYHKWRSLLGHDQDKRGGEQPLECLECVVCFGC